MKNTNVVLPIAGLGKRFSDGGYQTPKPLIPVDGKTIVEKSMDSLDYSDCNLIFIVRKEHVEEFNIENFLKKKFGQDIKVIVIDYLTEGALSTCLLAKEYIDNDEELIIFTPDCYFEPKFYANKVEEKYDGMVVVFESESAAHSYVKVGDNGFVSKAAEKEVISNKAVGGLYFWRKGKDFVKFANEMISSNDRVNNEFYICPVFNYLIGSGGKVGIEKNTKHVILGTPKDLRRHIKGN